MQRMKTCTLGICKNRHNAKGLCHMHYYRFRANGSPLINRSLLKTNAIRKNLSNWKRLYEMGYTTVQIAEEYNVHHSTVNRHLTVLGTTIRSQKTIKLGKNNPQWKGDKAGNGAIHKWIKSHYKKPELCQVCKSKPPYDLANISPSYNSETYTREFSNWEWLCRKCHMIKDGRMNRLHGKA